MIFKPLSPNKHAEGQQYTAAPTTSNTYTALHQDHVRIDYACPVSIDDVIKIIPQ